MGKTMKATCVICGRQYDVCLSCKDQNKIKPWRSITDSVNCYKVFLVLTQLNNGYISKEEAKSQLEQITFNKNSLREDVRNKVDEIMSYTIERTKRSKNNNVENENNCE